VANDRLRLMREETPRPVTLVDSSVLLDLALEDPTWMEWSADALAAAADAGRLAINPIIYAEVSIGYNAIEEIDAFLAAEDYERRPMPYEAGFLAGKAFLKYRRAGGAKRSPLPDFYIGAHAAVAGYRLLTRDKARHSTYFPTVPLIAP